MGLIPIGKTRTVEFALGGLGTNKYFGTPVNTIMNDKPRVPGGSSSGSATALARDMCSASVGTDTGGSIRQPASFTGTVGLKPTYGACSRYGIVAFASSLDQAGPMTRDVKDCALLFDVMSSYCLLYTSPSPRDQRGSRMASGG